MSEKEKKDETASEPSDWLEQHERLVKKASEPSDWQANRERLEKEAPTPAEYLAYRERVEKEESPAWKAWVYGAAMGLIAASFAFFVRGVRNLFGG